MKRATPILGIALCVFSLSVTPRPCMAETEAPVSPPGRAIAIEVVIVGTQGDIPDELAWEFSGPSDEVAARVRQLESEGQIVVIDRVRLTTVENQKAMFQEGMAAPVPSGRVLARGPGGEPQMSYQQQNVGTLITATPKVDGDAIVVQLEVEKSQLERRADQPQPEERPLPPATETLSSQVTLRIGSGNTVLASSLENTAGEASSARFVLASARLLEPSSDAQDTAATGGAEEKEIRIFSLQHVAAKDALAVITTLFDDAAGQRISADIDARSNSLIVSAQKEQLDTVQAILLRLDESDSWQAPQAPKDTENSDPKPVIIRYDKMEKTQLQAQLKRLQQEALDAAGMAQQVWDKAVKAKAVYQSAADDDKPDALLLMLEAEAASRQPVERSKQIHSELEAAKRAYLQLQAAESTR